MKKSIACGACRSSKRKCIHSGGPPCSRCRDRGDECIFPPKGTSFIFRRSRLERHGREHESASQLAVRGQARSEEWLAARSKTLAAVDAFEFLTDEVKNSYLRCSYKWSFHHIPNLLIGIREKTLDPLLVWAMLAITVRFSQAAPPGYSSQVEASNTFATHARSMVLSLVDQPTVHRAQVLLMLTGHSWGAGEGRRAWVYLGMAVRMAQVLGLFEEPTSVTTRDDFIAAEERRRTAWTCFLMDSLLSGGKGRDRMLSADKMRIQLPCESDSFNFGELVICERLDGSLPEGPRLGEQGSLGIVAYSMRVADVWGAVAKWACTPHDNNQPPWQPQSDFQYLLSRLNVWKDSLPKRLQYELFLLRAHSVSNQGQAYCYMHCIYFMSVIFLYRSYLPEVEMQKARVGDQEWDQWSAWSSKELVEVAEQVCEMLQEMRAFGLYFLRGLVPWIGFTIYTAVGTMLYFYHFPNPGDTPHQIERRREHIVEGLLFLKDMRQAWPMADTWREKIKAMQIFYTNIKAEGDQAVTPSERREMRNAIIDYGALQPDPVRQPDAESNDEQVGSSSEAFTQLPTRPKSATDGENDAAPTAVDFAPDQLNFIAPADIDLFDTKFEFGSNMHATFADTTQGFWESFPGSMDIQGDMGGE
ncbi:Zn(2)-C6 fungal-type domain-containing protein [Fusarium falciforme]|uniref:Zn(2)-C6 fungal-type domain-containing protein n=1 Tax=Fusarium falciforme TaxID=195108 RepID=UPI0023006CA6|nr:Zn(2)-C6 fungal-type domain-containing protein [Fusarium falciforme]WAO89026.1 Zn(2)-C6 fungal-type domain-containing protein [Fusarium falciforme]